jgi:hypothetical protein
MGESAAAATRELSAGAWIGGALLAVTPMLRPARYRLRLRHPTAARASDRIADHALPSLVVAIAVLVVVGLLPGMEPLLRFFWVGSAFGLLTGVPFVAERRRLRSRLRVLPAVSDPLDDLRAALPADPAAMLLLDGAAAGALRLVEAERDRDDPTGLRVGAMAAAVLGDDKAARARALRAVQVEPPVWDVPAGTGLYMAQRGRFGQGVRLLERAAEVSGGHHRAELMLAHGMALAGRLREAVEALDRVQGGPPRRA